MPRRKGLGPNLPGRPVAEVVGLVEVELENMEVERARGGEEARAAISGPRIGIGLT